MTTATATFAGSNSKRSSVWSLLQAAARWLGGLTLASNEGVETGARGL